ncbi:MAG: NADH-quinone oxidoreductase subunit NuoK [Actinomycetota bacterium]|nr:NADH-quinone oxidoreductase subunit NuoK [Actinomycetota bacterium]
MHLIYPLLLSAVLFGLGVYGLLARRNAVLVLMALELMLNAGNLNLIAFGAYLRDSLFGGQVFALFVIVIAAAEVGIGLAIVLLVYRNRETIGIDQLRALTETPVERVRQ